MKTTDCLQEGLFSDWQLHVSATEARERSSRVGIRSVRKCPRGCLQENENEVLESALVAQVIR